MLLQKRNPKGGASIIEVLSSMAIIIILASLLLSSVYSAREKSRTTMCLNNLKNLTVAMILFANDNNKYPGEMSFKQEPYEDKDSSLAYASLGAYYNNQVGVTQCPKVTGTINDSTPIYSYAINQLIRNVPLGKVQHPSEIILTSESLNRPVLGIVSNVEFRHVGTANAGFADGHVETVKTNEVVNALENYYESTPLDSGGYGVLQVPGPFLDEAPPVVIPFTLTTTSVCSNGFKWTYGGLTDNGDGTKTFTFTIQNNNNRALGTAAFELPLGVTALSPAHGATYTTANNTYTVENTTLNPFHAIKYSVITVGVRDSEDDVFTFQLNSSDADQITSMRVYAKAARIVGQGVFEHGDPGTGNGGCGN